MPADPFTKLFKLLIVVLKSMLRIFTNIEVVYYLTYGALAYVAMMVHPFFYAFHLTEFIIRYPTLSSAKYLGAQNAAVAKLYFDYFI